MRVSEGMEARWAASDGGLELAGGSEAVSCGGASERASVAGGVASLDASQALALMPRIGRYELDWGGVSVPVERVGSRYCSRADIVAYGTPNGDRFGDQEKYPDAAVEAAIQAAEEAIERGTGRSFCRRSVAVEVKGGMLEELPVVDAVSVSSGKLVGDRQVRAESPGTVDVVYGAACDRSIRNAAVQLAASLLRPRAAAENVRGQSSDGVYVSYTLATGDDGSWTGLPAVDAAIESHRSHRLVIA